MRLDTLSLTVFPLGCLLLGLSLYPEPLGILLLLTVPALFYTAAATGLGRFLAPAIFLTKLLVIPAHALIFYIVKTLGLILRLAAWLLPHSRQIKPLHPRTFDELRQSQRLAQYHHAPRNRLLLGHNQQGLVWAQLGEIVHNLLITGAVGEGKSTIVRSSILALLSKGPAIFQDWQIHIIDPKGGLGGHFQRIAQAYPDHFSIAFTQEQALATLAHITEIVLSRGDQMQQAYAERPADLGLNRILLVIDDFQNIRANKNLDRLMLEIINGARQAGVHVIAMTPYAHGEIVKPFYRVNFHSISGRLPAHAARTLHMPQLPYLPAKHFLYRPSELEIDVLFTGFMTTARTSLAIVEQFLAPAEFETELVILRLFIEAPGGLGHRALIRRGYELRRLASLPAEFPFSTYDPEQGQLAGADVARARMYVLDLLRHFEALGIAKAKPQKQGWAPVLTDYAQAKKLLKGGQTNDNDS